MEWTLRDAGAGGRDRRGANTGAVPGSGGRLGDGPGKRRAKGGDASRAGDGICIEHGVLLERRQCINISAEYVPSFLFASRSLSPPPQQVIEMLFSTGIRVRTTVVHEARNWSCRIGGVCE